MKSMLEVILDFYCSCTKVSQTKQLRRTHIYYLTIWLIRGLTQIFPDQDQNVSSFVFLSEGSRVQFVLVFSSFYWLPAFLGLQCPSYVFNTCNTVTLDLSCIVTFFPLTISMKMMIQSKCFVIDITQLQKKQSSMNKFMKTLMQTGIGKNSLKQIKMGTKKFIQERLHT